jgi:hypothetical protein
VIDARGAERAATLYENVTLRGILLILQ